MDALTIDDTARFVSILSFDLGSGDISKMSRVVQNAIEKRLPSEKGFIGSVVMANGEKSRLVVVSIWESVDAWSRAQYDTNVGTVVSDAVETATSYDIETYQTIAIVRA